MDTASPDELTQLIRAGRSGDQAAVSRLLELVYEDFREIASRARYVDDYGQTMQPTALANEAALHFMKDFAAASSNEREDREFFHRVIGMTMQTILRNNWRKQQAAKRGGGERPVAIHENTPAEGEGDFDQLDFTALDEALERMKQINPIWHRVVLHRYFAGRTIEQTAELLDRGITSVKLDWSQAKEWLSRELRSENS